MDFHTNQPEDLPEGTTLRLWHRGEVLFESKEKWLHPLFDLEEFLSGKVLDRTQCLLQDRAIGRAAAMLIAKMGIKSVSTEILSTMAFDVLKANGISYNTWCSLDRLGCSTENLLAKVTDLREAHRMLRERREIALMIG